MLRLPEVMRLTGRRRDALYGDIRASVFTRPVALGSRAVAWPASEVAALNRARIAGASTAELVALVDVLHRKRKAPGDEPGAEGGARRRSVGR